MMLTQTEGLLLIAGFFLLMQSLFLFFKKRQQTKEEYLEAMISNHAEIDNEGVNLNSPTVFESNQKQVEKIPEEKKEQQEEQLQQFEEAISKPNVLICPHCGKEIVM